MNILSIPDEIILNIITKLDLNDLKNLFLTCKKFLIYNEESLWKNLTFIKFPQYCRIKTDLMTWKQLCVSINYSQIPKPYTDKLLCGNFKMENYHYFLLFSSFVN